ncbi:SH3 domain-containing protein [Desulfovibrio gilichinskyi]|nr:SH3 domain-containing protein [Desulfovibrio gilichinskyi]
MRNLLFVGVLILFVVGGCIPHKSKDSGAYGSAKKVEKKVSTQVAGIAVSDVNMRQNPGKSGKKLAALRKGEKVVVLGRKGNWYKVNQQSSGKIGYVYYPYIDVQFSGVDSITGQIIKSTKVYAQPNLKNATKVSFRPGKKITALAKQGAFYTIKLDGKNSFVPVKSSILDLEKVTPPFHVVYVDAPAAPVAVKSKPKGKPKKTVAKKKETKKSVVDSSEESKESSFSLSSLWGDDEPRYSDKYREEKEVDPEEMLDIVRPSLTGYADEFAPVRRACMAKDYRAICELSNDYDGESYKDYKKAIDFAHEIGWLRTVERATLALDNGDFDKASKLFGASEKLADERDVRTGDADALQTGLSFLGTVSGQEGIGEYEILGYERVLSLNYKALAEILSGKKGAYNIAKRSIALQNRERDEFESMIRDLEIKEREKKNKIGANDPLKEFYSKVDMTLFEPKNKKERSAVLRQTSNAFINPFGDYLHGLILECESYYKPSLRSNAAIAYRKAAKLQPKAKKMLLQAKSDMGKPAKAYSNKRLVHVIVSEGFAPQKWTKNIMLPVTIPPMQVKTTELRTVSCVAGTPKVSFKGSPTRSLSEISNIEAISFRYDEDCSFVRTSNLVWKIGQSYVEKQMNILVSGLSFAKELLAEPDSRAWLSLPKKVYATRIFVKNDTSSATITITKPNGKILTRSSVKLPKGNAPVIIYGRANDDGVQLYASAFNK